MADDSLRISFFRLIGAIEMHEKASGCPAVDLNQRLYELAREEDAKHSKPQDKERHKALDRVVTAAEELGGVDRLRLGLTKAMVLEARSALQDSGGGE